MNKRIPNITETSAELKELISKNKKDLNRRQRLKMLYLFKTKEIKTRKQAANKLEVHRDTVGRWLFSYEQGGIKQMVEIKSTGKTGQRTLPSKVFEALKKQLNNSKGFNTYGHIQEWLKNKHKTEINYKTLHGIVYYKIKAKPKVPRPVNIKKR